MKELKAVKITPVDMNSKLRMVSLEGWEDDAAQITSTNFLCVPSNSCAQIEEGNKYLAYMKEERQLPDLKKMKLGWRWRNASQQR